MDEYDLGDRFRGWASRAGSQLLTFVLIHAKLVICCAVAATALIATGWIWANHRPAVPPPPSEWRIRQMMDAVQQADERVRSQKGGYIESDAEYRGVFETMRDRPVSGPADGASPGGDATHLESNP